MLAIIYDFGTSSVKTCLFEIDTQIRLVARTRAGYGLYFTGNGAAEQDTEEWWRALCSSTRELIEKEGVDPSSIEGLAFCSQMQGSVLVDRSGHALRRPKSFLDQQGTQEFKDCMETGLIRVSGCNLVKLVRNLVVNYAASISSKDPVWKYKWVERNEPEVFERVYKWLDVGDYLTSRCTGRITRTRDSAFATFLYDTRKGREGWNEGLLRIYGIRPEHMPEIIDCTDLVGPLRREAAEELGLVEGIPVFGGGGDTTFSNLGAGCTKPGDTHIYIGTSGWVSTVLDHQVVDVIASIASPLSAIYGYYNYYAELETAGKCFEWAVDHLVLDEFGIYGDETKVVDAKGMPRDPYEVLSEVAGEVAPGANGVIFTPWMHGNRCPFEDSKAGGLFLNVRIDNDRRDMVRAVLEGTCYHLRWLLERVERKVKTSDTIRFVGGGSLSKVVCQMLADICKRPIETVENPREVGAVGCALAVAAGLKGMDARELSHELVRVSGTYEPNPKNREVYDRNYRVFKRLYKSNAKSFRDLNTPAT